LNISTIYQNIKKLRELKNLTREYVAIELGMTVSGYSKIERGEVDIAFSRLQRIAEVFEVDILGLMSFDVNQILNFNHQQYTKASAPDPHSHAHTINLREKQINEKYIFILEKEVERLKSFENIDC